MAEKYILIVEQRNGTTLKQEGISVLEHGEKSRLNTYRKGVVRGLLMAGYKLTSGFMDSDILAKDEVRCQIYLITEQQWKDW